MPTLQIQSEKRLSWIIAISLLQMAVADLCHAAKAASQESTATVVPMPESAKAIFCASVEALTGLQSVAWPLVALLVILLIAFNARVGRLFGLLPQFVHKIRGPAGIEIEINADAARAVRTNFRASYQEFVAQAKDEYERMADARCIPELLRNVVLTALPEVMENVEFKYSGDDVRATVHVDDIVFRGFLYQLTNYFPAKGSGGVGRRFSQRYGIIGQSWRLNKSIGRGTAVGGMGLSPTEGDKKRAIRDLVARWGMTEDEAAVASHERPATLSVILRHDGQRHGVLYIDSTRPNAFGVDEGADRTQPDANKIARSLQAHRATVRLAQALASVLEPLRLAAPLLEIGQ